jgi:acyl-CoA thioesterase II
MDYRLAAVLQLLDLEQLEVNLFRGNSRDVGSPQVFGGQVLGQALKAAYGTVDPGRIVHSLHAYFLSRGDFNAPIVYSVDRARDGRSFTSRRVIAIQHGEQIFNMAASFQVPQPGVEHQLTMPIVPGPEELSGAVRADDMPGHLSERQRHYFAHEWPFEFRMVPWDAADTVPGGAPERFVWLRAVDKLPDSDVLHRCLLAYVSDLQLLATATLPHVMAGDSTAVVLASIDHAMWFHRPLRVDQWFLHAIQSPSASGARGFARASIFSRDGVLVASTAQEGLMRIGAQHPVRG